jgi:Asp-tRNA(Asn)/Glu-tRNA(Gln) amidotransferase A subunit family amidase
MNVSTTIPRRIFLAASIYSGLLLLSATPGVGAAAARAAVTFDLQTATIADINAAIDAGALNSEKLVGLYLKRIEAYDKQGPKINAVITMNPKALEEARALDAERKAKGRRSPLHGIPVVIKDLIDLAGFPTTAGFKPFGAPIAERDAGIVARLKDAGAIVLAKVSTTNWFGRDGFGPTHAIGATLNPYNAAYSPGGSSNGPGASMAAWFATVAVGTDTGGSVQSPSANNSLAGMVASHGLTSRTGIVPRGPTHDRAGPMGRSVYDITVLLGVMSGFDFEDRETYLGLGRYPQTSWADTLKKNDLSGRRIGVLREGMGDLSQNPEVNAMFEAALEDMRKGGAQIVDPIASGVNLAEQAATSAVSVSYTHELLMAGDVYLARLGPKRPYKTMREFMQKVGPEKFTDRYNKALTYGPPDKDPEFLRLLRSRTAMRELIESLADKYDLDAFVILYRSPPPPVNPPKGYKSISIGGNLTSPTGLPGVIVPAGYTKENLPVALQFLGKSFSDQDLLQIAYSYEQATRKRKSPSSTPPLPGEKFEY